MLAEVDEREARASARTSSRRRPRPARPRRARGRPSTDVAKCRDGMAASGLPPEQTVERLPARRFQNCSPYSTIMRRTRGAARVAEPRPCSAAYQGGAVGSSPVDERAEVEDGVDERGGAAEALAVAQRARRRASPCGTRNQIQCAQTSSLVEPAQPARARASARCRRSVGSSPSPSARSIVDRVVDRARARSSASGSSCGHLVRRRGTPTSAATQTATSRARDARDARRTARTGGRRGGRSRPVAGAAAGDARAAPRRRRRRRPRRRAQGVGRRMEAAMVPGADGSPCERVRHADIRGRPLPRARVRGTRPAGRASEWRDSRAPPPRPRAPRSAGSSRRPPGATGRRARSAGRGARAPRAARRASTSR